MEPYVMIEHAPQMNYRRDFVALPKNYGSPAYDNRPDVEAIRHTVFTALDRLHEKTGIGDKIRIYEKVIVKPNLVNVFHNAGYYDKDGNTDFPETTDPRVFDAVMQWLSRYNRNIVIAESSGKPFPTSASYKITGYDRIAKRYGAGLVCLEREPVVRYFLPKAEVMKEILIPRLFDDVVRKKAFYVSVPKMKTNIYTGVTLSFKNAMGTIPYYLRERNHTHAINKKLADMLYLFKPDMVVIDGIIGGEGNTPAPVDPVDVGAIIVSNHSVEADRVATRMMGFDPDEIKLMREVDKRGFGNTKVTVLGEERVTRFAPASPSLMRGRVHEKYPNIVALAGHNLPGAPEIGSPDEVDSDKAFALEQACVGGCLSSVAMGLEAASYGPRAKKHFATGLFVLEGAGVELNGKRYWFDKNGKAYTAEDIKKSPLKVLAMGRCAGAEAHALADFSIRGCCDPAECLNCVSNALGMVTDQLNPFRNKSLLIYAVPGLIGTILARTRWILRGYDVDVPRAHEDKTFEVPDMAPSVENYVAWPLPKLTFRDKMSRCRDMGNLFGSLTGILGMVRHYRRKKQKKECRSVMGF